MMIDLAVKIREAMVLTSELAHIVLQWGTVPSLRAGSALHRTLGNGVKS